MICLPVKRAIKIAQVVLLSIDKVLAYYRGLNLAAAKNTPVALNCGGMAY
jgi:hypothetical protein